MRKIPWFLMFLFLFIALFFSYKYYSLKNLASDISKAKCAPCTEYNNVGIAPSLDMNLVQTLAYNYQKSGASSTRSVWFSLETLKSFVYSIESKTCSCDSALGVRIYNGTYPLDNAWRTTFNPELGGLRADVMGRFVTNKYENINTIFMVPTHRMNNINYDFDPNDVATACNTQNKGYDIIKYRPASKENAGVFTTTRFGSSITALMAQNHGDACPPVAPPAVKCPDAGAYFDF